MSSSSMYVPYVMSLIPQVNGKTVIDVACGKGKWGYLVRIDLGGDNAYLVGCDVFKPNLLYVKEHAVYDDCVLCDVRKMPLREKVFDVVIAGEVLEHLEKAEGYYFLAEVDRICKGKLIVTTPNVFIPQNADQGNVHEVHKSIWSSSELKTLGFNVSGVGLKSPLPPFVSGLETFAFGLDRFMFGRRRKKLSKFLILIYTLMSVFSFFLPQIGVFLVAKKERINISV